MGKQAATIVDVARAAGVSPSTVSHALSGKREISLPVKERIFGKIRELDYRPSFYAQAMKRNSTGMIGVVVNECRNPSASLFLDTLAAELEKYSYKIVIGLAGLDHRKGEELLRHFSAGLVDGVINLLPQITPEEAQILCGSTPVVTNIREKLIPVRLDYDQLTRNILNYLWDLGHRRIGYITSPSRDPHRPDGEATRQIMTEFLKSHGEELDPRMIAEGDDSIEGGIAGTEQIMRLGNITAIFAGNDQTAFGIYRWAYLNGVRIPDDISVIGFDDVPQAATLIPPMTTVRFPVQELVTHTVKLLIAKLRQETLPPGQITLDMPLVIRHSVADRKRISAGRRKKALPSGKKNKTIPSIIL